MGMMEDMLQRRSVRQYSDRQVDPEDLGRVMAAGMLAPTGRGLRPWELVAVTDRRLLQALADCRALGAQMLRSAKAAVVVLGNPEVSDTWIEDCSLVMAHMQLMASSMGLGSCWVQGRGRTAVDGRTTDEHVRELLHVPDPWQLEAILSVGWPAGNVEPHDLKKLPFEKVHLDRF